MNNNVKIGILLVGLGVFILLSQLNIFSGQVFLAFLGGGFLVVYFMMGGRNNYGNLGFLIPGLVLLTLAVFTTGNFSQHPSLFFLFLSLAFWGVLFIHTFWFTNENWETRFWPVFPGAGLMLFAGFIYGVRNLDWSFRFLSLWNYLIPAVLIIIGIRFLLKKPGK